MRWDVKPAREYRELLMYIPSVCTVLSVYHHLIQSLGQKTAVRFPKKDKKSFQNPL